MISILPFLAILWCCHQKLGLPSKSAILIAWLSTALIFGALHLPTYDWNFSAMFSGDRHGPHRAAQWLHHHQNIWVSTGSHIINDWLLFSLMLLGSHTGT